MAILTVQRKKQRKLIVLMGVVFIITLGVLYFGPFRQPKEAQVIVDSEINIFKKIREIKLDLGLLKEERFRGLVPYSKIPTDIKTGRSNPFAPYGVSTVQPVQEFVTSTNATSTGE